MAAVLCYVKNSVPGGRHSTLEKVPYVIWSKPPYLWNGDSTVLNKMRGCAEKCFMLSGLSFNVLQL